MTRALALIAALSLPVHAKDMSRVPQTGDGTRLIKIAVVCEVSRVKFKRDAKRNTTAVSYAMTCAPVPRLLMRSKLVTNVFSEINQPRTCGARAFRIGVCNG
jgi:hypothetical protein